MREIGELSSEASVRLWGLVLAYRRLEHESRVVIGQSTCRHAWRLLSASSNRRRAVASLAASPAPRSLSSARPVSTRGR